jgi:TrmH family RNA methyltransferase
MGESKPVVIRSAANPRIRHLIRMRDNRARRKAESILVDGWRETTRALDAGLTLNQLYIPESATDQILGPTADRTADRTTIVSDSLMQKICYGNSSRGVVAEFDRPGQSIDQLRLRETPLVLVLDRIEKPGNVGAIFRCADAAGIDAILLCESADPLNPNAIRNSLGSVFHVQSAAGTEADLGKFLVDHQIAAVAARVQSSTPLWEADLRGPLAVIVGSEADGLGDRWSHLGAAATDRIEIPGVRIPMLGRGDSLNVAMSAAVICYEARRQRQP